MKRIAYIIPVTEIVKADFQEACLANISKTNTDNAAGDDPTETDGPGTDQNPDPDDTPAKGLDDNGFDAWESWE